MRHGSLVTLSLLLCACTFRAPRGIPVRVSGSVRADVHVQARATVDVAVVPLQGAPVAEFFGIPLADARQVLFVLDVSGSMSETATGQLASVAPPSADPNAAAQPHMPTKMEVAQAELIDAIAKLPPGSRANILIFSELVDAYAPAEVVLDETIRADMIAFVRDMRPETATALQPAMRAAFLMNAPRIVLLSDGLGNIGGGPEDIMRDVSEAMRGGVRIDTIGIGPSQDTKLLALLASQTGGLYQQF
jgi:hypothetical protein